MNQSALTKFMFETRVNYPGFQIRRKTDSTLMKVIAFLLLIVTFGQQKTFMTDYVTTVGQKVYVPDGFDAWDEYRKLVVLRHERVHMEQARRYGLFLFGFLYLCVPFPLFFAYFRAKFEWEAYEESMRAVVERNGLRILDDPKYKKSIFDHFTTGAYGWMWPFTRTLEAWYEASRRKIAMELNPYG